MSALLFKESTPSSALDVNVHTWNPHSVHCAVLRHRAVCWVRVVVCARSRREARLSPRTNPFAERRGRAKMAAGRKRFSLLHFTPLTRVSLRPWRVGTHPASASFAARCHSSRLPADATERLQPCPHRITPPGQSKTRSKSWRTMILPPAACAPSQQAAPSQSQPQESPHAAS